MQVTQQTRTIEEDENKQVILDVLSDKYCRTILEATMNEPKSAIEISNEYKIPISTIYRRLQNLHDNKLLRISGQISNDGKKFFLYQSKIKAIATSFDGNHIEIHVVPNIKE